MNNRSYRRITIDETADATVLGRPDVTIPCHVLNVSRSGLCIAMDHQIRSGQTVKLEWGNHFLLGRALRVLPEGARYRVGVELLYCSQWNRSVASVFVPLWLRSIARRCVSMLTGRSSGDPMGAIK
jgi:PilZ domain-containing protein